MKNTVVKNSSIHGRGLFAFRKIFKGEIIEPIEGKIIFGDSKSRFSLKFSKGQSLILTNKTKWINHSNDPNVTFNLKRESVIALKDIDVGEEMFSRYNSVF